MKYQCCLSAYSSQGPRKRNDDSTLAVAVKTGGGEVVLFCVADGVGGSSHGDLASRIAVRSLYDFIASSSFTSLGELKERFPDFLKKLNEDIARSVGAGETANTTLTACMVFGKESLLIHSGDSMLCKSRVGATDFAILSDTHSCKMDAVREKGDEDAGQGISNNAISAGLGSGFTKVRYQVLENFIDPEERCWLIAMTDGVHGVVPPSAIMKLCTTAKSPGGLAQSLVQTALDSGTKDNATAAVFRAGPWRPRGGGLLGKSLIFWAVLVLSALSGILVISIGTVLHFSRPDGGDEPMTVQTVLATNQVDALIPVRTAYETAKKNYNNAVAQNLELLDKHNGGLWKEVKSLAALGAASANDLVAGAEAYEKALAGLPAAVDEANARRDDANRKAKAEAKWADAKKTFEDSGKEWKDVNELATEFIATVEDSPRVGGDADWVRQNVDLAGGKWIKSAKQDMAVTDVRSKDVDAHKKLVEDAIAKAKGL